MSELNEMLNKEEMEALEKVILQNQANFGADESIKLVDPVQVEKDMIEEAKRKSEDPAEQAAMVFTMYKSNFERALKKLKGKAHTRLLNALVMAPLVEAPLLTEAEKEAYFFGDSMIQAKFVMAMDMYKNSAQEILDGVTVETTYEKGEENV